MSRNPASLSPQASWSTSTREPTRKARNSGIQDPPRLARDGYEWVWFPEGYWAERQTSRRTSSKASGATSASSAGRIFRWPSRTNACSPPPQEHELRDLAPKAAKSGPAMGPAHFDLAKKSAGSFSPPRTLPQSPWLTEAAQVQALQRPASQQMSFAGIDILNNQSPQFRKTSSGETSNTIAGGRKKRNKSKSSWNLFQRLKVSSIEVAFSAIQAGSED
jgi:hypothetical protein